MAQIALDVHRSLPARLAEAAREHRARAARFRLVRRLLAEREAGRDTGARI